jgi:threonine aldolase
LVIDFSSDTATRPSHGMREFMAKAPVGDEQRREDPSVNELQNLVAELTGKEAGLFLPSGTMCNAIAYTVQCGRGEAIIMDKWAHPNIAEGGGPAMLAGAMIRPMDGVRGVFTADQARVEISTRGTHISGTALISVENTTNRGGGKIWPLENLADLRALCDEHGIAFHMDGARLMNAVIGSGHTAKTFAAFVDTVWIDLSKGLGAPVGAVLAGPADFIEEARLYKHRFGGAMRQAGVIAAAGLYAFEHNVERLGEDHANAKLIEDGLKTIPGIVQRQGPVETNIILFDVAETGKTSKEVETKLEEQGVRMSPYVLPTWIRAVTHLDVSREDCEKAVEALQKAVA